MRICLCCSLSSDSSEHHSPHRQITKVQESGKGLIQTASSCSIQVPVDGQVSHIMHSQNLHGTYPAITSKDCTVRGYRSVKRTVAVACQIQ